MDGRKAKVAQEAELPGIRGEGDRPRDDVPGDTVCGRLRGRKTALARAAYRYVPGKKSRIGPDAPSAKAFAWLFPKLAAGAKLDDLVELYHEGRCGRCGRTLTVPESVATGFGPNCAAELGVPWEIRDGEGVPQPDLTFVLAGNARFTVVSKRTGTRFTYRVRKADEGERRSVPWFVSVLTGPENDADFTYLGVIWEETSDEIARRRR
jgi:hypothetical protein